MKTRIIILGSLLTALVSACLMPNQIPLYTTVNFFGIVTTGVTVTFDASHQASIQKTQLNDPNDTKYYISVRAGTKELLQVPLNEYAQFDISFQDADVPRTPVTPPFGGSTLETPIRFFLQYEGADGQIHDQAPLVAQTFSTSYVEGKEVFTRRLLRVSYFEGTWRLEGKSQPGGVRVYYETVETQYDLQSGQTTLMPVEYQLYDDASVTWLTNEPVVFY